ncbi:MAG: PspA/IM30 family protein, partial [Atopobiaceae bacterium]|nr:PspA/IM30 family protein [Atopobiaceae bacterium]
NELADAEAKVADWNDKAKLALKNGNEELARKALDVKVGLDEQVVQLRASYDNITEQVNKLKDQVQTLRVKLDEARARQNVLAARSKMAEAAQSAAKSVNTTSLDSAFAKLDRLEAKIIEKESVAEAYTDINIGEIDAEEAFADMAHKAAIDSELDRLKAELDL